MKLFKKIFAVLGAAAILFAEAPETRVRAADYASGYYNDDVYERLPSKLRKKINKLDNDPVKKLPIPVLFGVDLEDITPNFGDPRSGGRTHEGQDIMAIKGTPIVSPTEAVVLECGEWDGAGYYVSTVNPGGENFIYMHLNDPGDLDPGDWLDEGDLIGFAGNTGNAASTLPHLHLEIRRGGEATNPYKRLKREYNLEEKIEFANRILSEAKTSSKLANFMVENFSGELLAAQAEGIDIPNTISKKITKITKQGAELVNSDLTVGALGDDVFALQNYLITQNKGPAATSLAAHGATGYFGPLTLAAVNEFRQSELPAAASKKMSVEEIKIQISQIQALLIQLTQQLAEMQKTRGGA